MSVKTDYNKKVFLCTDGNATLGMGHIYQTVALIGHLSIEIDKQNILIATKSDELIVELLRKTEVKVLSLSNDEEVFDEILNFGPDCVVIDNLNVSVDLAKKIKLRTDSRLVILTNLSDANSFADVTVMAGMGSGFKNIRIENENQVQLWGPKYWLLRPEFLNEKDSKTKNRKVPANLLLIFGGSDQANLSTTCLKVLKEIEVVKRIGIVLGASFSNYQSFDPVFNEVSKLKEVTVYRNVNNVAELMKSYELVLASPGLSFFESLLQNTPVLCFHQNDFQKEAWEGFIPTYDLEDVKDLDQLISNKIFVFPDDENITKMEIGEGWKEIVYEILKN